MNRENVGSYLWIVVTVIIMLCLLAFASPFGTFIKNNLEQFTGNFVEEQGEQNTPLTEYFKLTIHYDTADSKTSLDDVVLELKKYEQYNVPSPSIDGYVPDSKIVEGSLTEDTEITVRYSRGNYSITYITNNGIWNTDLLNVDKKLLSKYTSYTYGTRTILLGEDKISYPGGKEFGGWYETKDFTGSPVTEITETDSGNKIYYAKWNSEQFNINYILNDTDGTHYYNTNEYKAGSIADWDAAVTDKNGDLKPEYTKYSYGSQFKLPTTLHKFGYTFVGWSEIADGDKVKGQYRTQITETDSGDITLYAHWKRNIYTITYHTDFVRPTGEKAYYDIQDTEYTITDSSGNKTTHKGYPKQYSYGDTIVLPTKVKLHGYDKTEDAQYGWYNKATESITILPGGESAGTVSGYPMNAVRKTVISPVTANFIIGSTSKHAYDHTNLDLYIMPIPDTYTVTFISNLRSQYTTANMSEYTQTFLYDEQKNLTDNKFRANGRTFKGWNTKPDGSGTSFTNAQNCINLIDIAENPNSDNINLYAQWEIHSYNIKYDLNQGDGTTVPKFAPNATYPDKATYDKLFVVHHPIRTGYTFEGWKVIDGLDKTTAKYALYSAPSLQDLISITSTNITCKSAINSNFLYFLNLTPINNGTVTLQAQWIPNGPDVIDETNKCYIEYDLNGKGTYSSVPEFGYLHPEEFVFDENIEISNPTMVGYEFTGWTIENMDTDIPHYYGNKQYVVKNQKVEPDKTQSYESTLTNIMATHFLNLKAKGTVKFTANWEPITYNIKYDYNDNNGTTSTEINATLPTKGTFDKSLSIPPIERQGYIFDGWTISSEEDYNTFANGYSKSKISVVNNKLTSNSTINKLPSLSDKTTYSTPIKISHCINLSTIQNNTVTLTAHWTPIKYNVTYNYNFTGKESTTETATYDKGFYAPVPERKNFEFTGWKISGMDSTRHYHSTTPFTIANKQVQPNNYFYSTTLNTKDSHFLNLTSVNNGNVIFIAQWTPSIYKITLDPQINPETEKGSRGTPVFYEKYSVNNYSDYSCSTPINKIIVPNKEGFYFEGYFDKKEEGGTQYVTKDGNIISTPTTFEAHTTLYARWTPKVFKITLNPGIEEGKPNNLGTQAYYEKYTIDNFEESTCQNTITNIVIPSQPFYNFAGYFDKNDKQYVDESGEILSTPTTFLSNTTLYAKWTPKVYKISLSNYISKTDKSRGDYNLGSSAYYQKYGINIFEDADCLISATTIDIPEKVGHTFGGYVDINSGTTYIDKNGKILSNSTTFSGDHFLNAKWNPNIYKITLDPQINKGDTGTKGTPAYYEKYTLNNYKEESCDNVAKTITPPTKIGYTFKGYYSQKRSGTQYVDKNGNILSENTDFLSNTTLYAQWTPITYKIEYDLNGGAHGKSHPSTATFDVSFTVDNPTKSKYKFVEWEITKMCNKTTHYYGSLNTNKSSINSAFLTYKNLHSAQDETVYFTAVWEPAECQHPKFEKITQPAGCTTPSKKYDVCTTCGYKKNPVNVSSKLGHRATADGTCITHHHNDPYDYTYNWGWTCHYAHSTYNGSDRITGFTDAYCARRTEFKDHKTYSCKGANGKYYCGYRKYSWCYKDGGFYKNPHYTFNCNGEFTNAASVIRQYRNDETYYKNGKPTQDKSGRPVMISNHSECDGYGNCKKYLGSY